MSRHVIRECNWQGMIVLRDVETILAHFCIFVESSMGQRFPPAMRTAR
jgi:hypothetical protein